MQKENWEKNYKYVSFSYLICITERLTRTMNRVVHNRIVEVCLALSSESLLLLYSPQIRSDQELIPHTHDCRSLKS